MKQLFLVVLAIFTSFVLQAQVINQTEMRTETTHPDILQNIDVEQDTRLADMLQWHIENNDLNKQLEGFRVEIFFSSDFDAREKALRKKIEFLKLFPNNTVHIKYISPNFRVRVGDYRTKNEALKLYKEIKNNYPLAFIVSDNIDFPLLKP